MTKIDPRAEFDGRTSNELADERDALHERQRILAGNVTRMRPTREEVEAKIATAQDRVAGWLGAQLPRALDAMLNANLGTPGFRDAEAAAKLAVLASDDFAALMRAHVAAKRQTEAEVAPALDELDDVRRRIDAITAELALRELDDEHDRHAEQRAALVERLKGEAG